MEFEKAWEDRNPRKAYALLSSKMKRCSPVLNTANGVAVGEATLPIWKEHFKTLLNRLAPSAPELEHVHRPTYAVNEEPPGRRSCRVRLSSPGTSSQLTDGVPEKFVRLLDDMNQRTTAAVRTSAGCTTPFEVVTGVRQGAVAGPFLFNFAIDDIMRRTIDRCPADIVLAPSG
ncbi:hypothetical protein RB195_017814 [Necator americanus]|uniref:Reverse transcriptase domain-containing protein n=1 Tax=Necator americanus TaxID=51031 RepID=A0ABR1C6X1_NECAM